MMADFSNVSDFEAAKARIAIVGCGGAGNNTVTALFQKGISGATTIAINTDAKHLSITKANQMILIGKSLTKGLGAGGFPEVGKNAALESKGEIRQALDKVDLVFVTCGLGGGTGTGSAPVVSRIAKDAGAIVIAAVTLPFKLEGARINKAEEGLAELRKNCDTVIAIENQRLLKLAGNQTLKKAFAVADDLIATMIKGITETISEPSLV
ncbi:MAG: cell division protein FtsZ, partial [Candidatus Aenigmarchaeota archaeon]|nr:cell division protein FtsZ [Candidatus Aenigmarchaeota archaeon]